MTPPLVSEAELAACEREPIHIPGTIQPHGFLLAFDAASWAVAYASENVFDYLGRPAAALLGVQPETVLGDALTGRLRQAAADPLSSRRAISVERVHAPQGRGDRRFALVAHRHGGFVILEGELLREREADALPDQHYQLEATLARFETAPSIEAVLQTVAEETRRITGFDRVLVYRFDEQWNGIVIAEDRNDVLPSYLDLRFPASDIPRQARELYRINRLRLIARASYEPVRIVAATRDAAPLDLSLSILRSVSPVHLEYMRNMGTGSSMSISLMRGGALWGLISCHSREPRFVPFEVRATCDLLGQTLSLQLAAREQAAALAYRMQLGANAGRLLTATSRTPEFGEALVADPALLLGVTGGSGAAVLLESSVALVGRTPTEGQLAALVDWLSETATDDVYVTEALAAAFPAAREYAAVASGLVAISISRVHRSYVLWFRPEQVSTVKWGGDPTKSMQPEAGGAVRLHPRKSFNAWTETVRGRCAPWHPAEIESARELRTGLVNIVLRNAEKLAALSEQLQRTNNELEAFSYTVSHDLRAPFRHIRGYTELLKAEKAGMLDEEGRIFVDNVLNGATYAGRMVDNILSFSQIGRTTLHIAPVNLRQLVDALIAGEKLAVPDRKIEWTVGELPTVEADPGMLRTVVQSLIENAVKFTRERPVAKISITSRSTPREHVITVTDNGVGFDMQYKHKLFGIFQRLHGWEAFEGTGIGLASVRRIVLRHGGRVLAESTLGEGAAFSFALPTTPVTTSPLYA